MTAPPSERQPPQTSAPAAVAAPACLVPAVADPVPATGAGSRGPDAAARVSCGPEACEMDGQAPAVPRAPTVGTPTVVTPAYWPQACAELSVRDAVLRQLIERYGTAQLQSHGDAFVTLARSIVGQQISVRAAQAVWDRLVQALAGQVHAQAVLAATPEQLRAAGLSGRKVEYLCDLARHFAQAHDGQPQRWAGLPDEAIVAELSAIRGIGRWTAEMFLIFHLLRPNVLPLDDVGLLKSISLHYTPGQPVTRSQARVLAQNWQPWCSVATWYLWRALDPLPVAY